MFDSITKKLSELKNISRLRTLQTWSQRSGQTIRYGDKEYINLSSNDYLAVGTDDELSAEFMERYKDDLRFSSSSSRSLTGNSADYAALEDTLSGMFGKPALVFNSGYHANTGIISSVVSRGDAIFSDKLNHASIIDGALLSRSELIRYKHKEYDELEKLLKEKRKNYRNVLITSESLFSMDGDAADIRRLVKLKKKYSAGLYIDEAHAFGVYGKSGLGLAEESGVLGDIDILVGTFGKAAGSYGAFAVTGDETRNFLINSSRSFIFSTALPPVQLKWTNFILEHFPAFKDRREKLIANGHLLREKLNRRGYETLSSSFIVPVVLGTDEAAVNGAEKCRENGFYLLPIRPPTVPQGEARLRISLNPFITGSDMDRLIGVIDGV